MLEAVESWFGVTLPSSHRTRSILHKSTGSLVQETARCVNWGLVTFVINKREFLGFVRACFEENVPTGAENEQKDRRAVLAQAQLYEIGSASVEENLKFSGEKCDSIN